MMTYTRWISLISAWILWGIPSYGAGLNLDKVVEHWHNEEEMTPYFKAMSTINGVLDEVIEDIKKDHPKPKGGDPQTYLSHSPTERRSANHMFLATSQSDGFFMGQSGGLFKLEFWTPLGMVSIHSNSGDYLKPNIFTALLEKLDKRWVLEDVTEKVQVGFFIFKKDGTKELTNKRLFHTKPFEGLPFEKNQKIFLIKSFDDHVFIEGECPEAFVFGSLILAHFEDYVKSRDLFGKLSGGTHRF